LVELLHNSKRVTDYVGHVGSDKIAVLCPDTDGAGIRGFMEKIESRAGDLPFAGVAATYPDELFDTIANGKRTQAAFVPFLASDATERRGGEYSLKRGLDIVGALVAICLLAPLMLVVAAIIASTSRGPIIFRQTRVGKGGAPFTFYKFRSMVTDVDDSIHREYVASLIKNGDAHGVAPNGKQATYKLKADPRVTPIGRLIRKTSIDELPQFFNVLKGDMSLVGPRPPVPFAARHDAQAGHHRHLADRRPQQGVVQRDGANGPSLHSRVLPGAGLQDPVEDHRGRGSWRGSRLGNSSTLPVVHFASGNNFGIHTDGN
jgi:lipopolysaccharide/colanic/teichoic acid biosynthesis glycosyltransferase